MVGFELNVGGPLEADLRREWVLTNGIGGYAGGSVTGALNRTHQGYLIASLHPPVERFIAHSKTEERVIANECVTDLSASVHMKDGRETAYEGNRYMKSFLSDGAVMFSYEVGSLRIRKTVALRYGENKCAVLYRIENLGSAAKFIVTPLFNWREHSTPHTPETVKEVLPADCACVCTTDTGEHEAANPTENGQHESTVYAAENGSDSGGLITVVPRSGEHARIRFSFSGGRVQERSEKYDLNILLKTETDNEAEGLDCAFKPYDIVYDVSAGETKVFGCICEVITEAGEKAADGVTEEKTDIANEAQAIIMGARERAGELAYIARRDPEDFPRHKHILTGPADVSDSMLFEALSQAADNFIAFRSSTGLSTVLAGLPWFTDWGRDTMIAFTGLTLVTGRFDEAEAILKTFARYEKDGLIPNMFPDGGQEPLYNTADASLWYFYAVHKYLEYTAGRHVDGENGILQEADRQPGKDRDDVEPNEFIRTEIWPCLKHIIAGYKNGTHFSIKMDEDGLIHAGGGFDQVTWMDVRVGDWVATPRHGKPVEINALWYNALKIAEKLAKDFGDPDAGEYAALADKVKDSFNKRFRYEEGGYLFDVVDCDADSLPRKTDGSTKGAAAAVCDTDDAAATAWNRAVDAGNDPRLRPNQIYAVSLPYSLLDPGYELSVVEAVKEKLYAGCGLRSLDPAYPDYHPIYLGSLEKRDHAYHQGTAWGFMLGAFITAYVKTHGRTEETRSEAAGLIAPVKA
ncbi:MAG: glycogen debranching enzyme family protein, partial [Lachnospiraceae bacterium]|nr:glycogen debranching enzyme family protein [Lachnospiraceae bacterium]